MNGTANIEPSTMSANKHQRSIAQSRANHDVSDEENNKNKSLIDWLMRVMVNAIWFYGSLEFSSRQQHGHRRRCYRHRHHRTALAEKVRLAPNQWIFFFFLIPLAAVVTKAAASVVVVAVILRRNFCDTFRNYVARNLKLLIRCCFVLRFVDVVRLERLINQLMHIAGGSRHVGWCLACDYDRA